MRSLALIASCVLAILLASAPAGAARKPITGKLSKPSYSVIALASNGKAKSAPATRSRFSVRPPAKRVTLHLRAPNGTYAGPVVVGREKNGRRAILGVRAGARLGEIAVRRGFAKVGSELDEQHVDAKRMARSKRGVPIGARRFGRVRSKPLGASVPGDRDADGIPDPLDVDDDGDLILDNLDRVIGGTGGRVAQSEGGCGPNGFYCPAVSSYLALASFAQTVNVNAGSSTGQIDAALSSIGYLRFSPASESAELDCGGEPDPGNPDGWTGGLSYCTREGTGVVFGGPSNGSPFPGPPGGEFDADSDGFGTFPKPSFLAHRATTAQIKTGDVLTQRVTSEGAESEVVATLNYVFVTIPALVSYSDTAGNSATVSYPVAADGPGTFGHGFPVSAPAGEDVVLTLTFWRPQRAAIPGSDPAGAEWMDVDHLTYAAGAPPAAGGCPQSTFATTDPNLAPPSVPLLGMGGLADSKDAAPPSPQSTLTYQLNLSECLEASGLSFDPGDEQMLTFLAVAGATDTAQQTVSFKRE